MLAECGARPYQRHRNRDRVIDQHLLTHGHVEFVGDQRVDQVPRESGVARDRAGNRNAPAFVGAAIFGRRRRRRRSAACRGRNSARDRCRTPRRRPAWRVPAIDGRSRSPRRTASNTDRSAFLRRSLCRSKGRGSSRCRRRSSPWSMLPADRSFALNASTLMPVCCAPMSCTLRPKIPASLAR